MESESSPHGCSECHCLSEFQSWIYHHSTCILMLYSFEVSANVFSADSSVVFDVSLREAFWWYKWTGVCVVCAGLTHQARQASPTSRIFLLFGENCLHQSWTQTFCLHSGQRGSIILSIHLHTRAPPPPRVYLCIKPLYMQIILWITLAGKQPLWGEVGGFWT